MTSYSGHSDQQLSSLLRGGDHGAFTEIYNRYWSVLYLHARHMLSEREQARDAVQEIFTGIWNRPERLEKTSNLNAYLYKAVRNHIFNMIRHEKVEADYISEIAWFYKEGVATTEETVRFNELSAIIDKEVELMPEKMREVFQLSRKYQLSHAEIAAQLNISETTVKKQVNKALRILRLKLHLPLSVLLVFIKF